MIATIVTIVEIELKSISAVVVATIAEEWFPYDRNDRSAFFQRSFSGDIQYTCIDTHERR